MEERKPPMNPWNEEILKAFDRERSEAEKLGKRHKEEVKNSYQRDRQVLIERRRHPR